MEDDVDWAKVYRSLHDHGRSDSWIAAQAGVTRSVVNAVRNSTYAHNHEPGYKGGRRVLAVLKNITE
jgi:hypothetical protein